MLHEPSFLFFSIQTNPYTNRDIRVRIGTMKIGLEILALVCLSAIALVFILKLKDVLIRLYITLQGPFFGATSDERIRDLIQLAKIKPGDKVVDLGSGDGCVLIALAQKYNIEAVGYEIDPKYVKISREKIAEAGLNHKITIHDQSFWEADISKFDMVVIFCVPRFLKRIEQKFTKELKSSANVYSIFFRFPTWKPVKELGDIRMYRKKT
jgi:2-polyprenyl-3-methyl-5-hydroxy-6-metoxy-1,4-benzoquinol methylase